MTDPIEDDLRRALDDVLATCWADEFPILDAPTEAVTDWTAQIEAEFNESKAFEPGPRSQELADRSELLSRDDTAAINVFNNEWPYLSGSCACVCWPYGYPRRQV